MTHKKDAILELLATGKPFTQEKMVKKTGLSRNLVSSTLAQMRRRGELHVIGKAINSQRHPVNCYQQGKKCPVCNTVFFKTQAQSCSVWQQIKTCSRQCGRYHSLGRKKPELTPHRKKQNRDMRFYGDLLSNTLQQHPRELDPKLSTGFIRGQFDHPDRLKMRQIRKTLIERRA